LAPVGCRSRDELFHCHRSDAAERRLRQRITQQLTHAAPTPATAQRGKAAGLLLPHPRGDPCQRAGIILDAVIDAILVEVREIQILLPRPLSKQLSELPALLGRHAGEGGLGRLFVRIVGELRGDLLVTIQGLVVGDTRPWPSLVVSVDEVSILVALLATGEQILEQAHHVVVPPLKCFDGIGVALARNRAVELSRQ